MHHENDHLDNNILFEMSSQTMTELVVMGVLASMIQSDLRVATAPVLYILDAFSFGGVICKINVPII